MTYSAIPGDKNKCECTDSLCPCHTGVSDCTNYATVILYRVDMKDNTGTAMCECCAADAVEWGFFTDEIEDEDETDA